jgi:sugar-specific transcriptional regulator TrmB
MLGELLREVGLTKTETKIYLTLLEEGPSLAGVLSRKSGIHRRSVYDALERLIEKGLVSYIKTNNRKYFEAVNPKKLLHILDEKKEAVKSIMPELELKYNLVKEKRETLFFRGKSGMKSLLDDQITSKKEIWVIGASTKAINRFKWYFQRYDRLRKEKKIKAKMIFSEDARKDEYMNSIPGAEVRFLSRKPVKDVTTNIYGDRVAIIVMQHEPIAVLIKDASIADCYKSYFELMWGLAKK